MSEPAQSTPSSSRVLEELMHKNSLQAYTQRACLQLPVYQTINEGVSHAPKFRSTVLVDGAVYTSPGVFSNRKAAEQDVAKHALACILQKAKDEICPFIEEDASFCKSILNEFAAKTNLEKPTYNTIQSEGLPQVFVSTAVVDGATYTGNYSKNKKEAEQFAARAAIVSLLGGESGRILLETIKSKAKRFDALHKDKESSSALNRVFLWARIGGSEACSSRGEEVGASVHASLGEHSDPQVVSGGVEINAPKPDPLVEAIPNTLMLAPSANEQPLDIRQSSGKKRNRKNKKKPRKKLKADPQAFSTNLDHLAAESRHFRYDASEIACGLLCKTKWKFNPKILNCMNCSFKPNCSIIHFKPNGTSLALMGILAIKWGTFRSLMI